MYLDLTTIVSQDSPLIQWANSQDNPHVAMGHIGTHLDTYEKSAIPLEYFKSSGILFDVRGIPEVGVQFFDLFLQAHAVFPPSLNFVPRPRRESARSAMLFFIVALHCAKAKAPRRGAAAFWPLFCVPPPAPKVAAKLTIQHSEAIL